MNFYTELKRRNVFRVAIAYLAGAWLLIQVADTLFPVYGVAPGRLNILTTVLAIGFPLFLVFSWVFEWTPEGLKRETEVDRDRSITRETGKRLDRAIILMLTLALGYFAFDKFVLQPARDVVLAETAALAGAEQALKEAEESAISDHSIAVLPFVNMSEDADNEYFSDGISEELLNLLARMPELQVAARTSSFYFKGKDLPITEIADSLKVAHVLEGSVRKAGNHVRITVQLIKADNGYHLWSQTYDRTLDDIFQIQDEIASVVVEKLKVSILGDTPRTREVDPEAYALYLQGRYLIRRRGEENLANAVATFKRALELDPDHALAWVGLADAYGVQTTFYLIDFEEGKTEERQALERALELDDSLAEAHAGMATFLLQREWDWPAALESITRSERLNPHSHEVILNKARFVSSIGNWKEEIELREMLITRDPLNANQQIYLSAVLERTGRVAEAKALRRRAYEINPQRWFQHRGFGRTLLGEGNAVEALREFEQEPDPVFHLQGLAMALHTLNRLEEAEAALNALINEHGDLRAFQIAEVFAWRGENKQAFTWLEKARDQESTWMWGIRAFGYPYLYLLVDDTRWQPFLETIGVSDRQIAELDYQQLLTQ